MRKILIIILLNCLFCGSLFCKDIGETIKNDASSLWSLSRDEFKNTFGPSEMYKWQAFNKNLLYSFDSGKPKLYFLGQQIDKASFKFPDKCVNGMYLTLKKTPAKTDKDTYLKNIKDLQDKINVLDKFSPAKVIKRISGKWYRHSCSWKSPQYSIFLRWSYSRDPKAPFESQNTKLSVFYSGIKIVAKDEVQEKETSEKVTTEGASTKKELINENKLEPDAVATVTGDDFYLKVPMITEASPQNSLSTCVSRVMNYYAQQASKDSKGKNQIDKNRYNFVNPANARYDIEDMLKKSFSIKEVMSSEYFEDYIKFSSVIFTYNGYAENKLSGQYNKIINSYRKLKNTNYILMKIIPSVKRNNVTTKKTYVYLVNMIEVILKMDEEAAWIKTRCKNKSKVKSFKKKICKQITDGKPVIWDVILGIVKENGAPAVMGKYVRLIVGYNDKTNELIYSDSLGKGHEIKKMSWDKAWAITYKTVIINSNKK